MPSKGKRVKTRCVRGHKLPQDIIKCCQVCKRENGKRWCKRHPEKRAVQVRVVRLRSYGWTPEMIKQTALEQGGCCMICKHIYDGKLHPDHAHTIPPQPRGLLCPKCNKAIGLLQDSPELCRAAAEYLESWKVGVL